MTAKRAVVEQNRCRRVMRVVGLWRHPHDGFETTITNEEECNDDDDSDTDDDSDDDDSDTDNNGNA